MAASPKSICNLLNKKHYMENYATAIFRQIKFQKEIYCSSFLKSIQVFKTLYQCIQ